MQYSGHNTSLVHHTDRRPMGLGQYDGLGDYFGPYAASFVFLILLPLEVARGARIYTGGTHYFIAMKYFSDCSYLSIWRLTIGRPLIV